MSKIEVNQISSQCGSTLTIGQSGDTVTLASGATQSGFGRTGTVDWDTTAKTASFTAVSGNGYFVNTTSGAITVTLPAGSAGSIVSLKDYANTWQTNNVTVTPNGSDKINAAAGNATLSTEDQSVTLVYVDSTQGWRAVQDSTSSVAGFTPIVATGGTVTTCGNYKIHTFTAPGTFCVSCAGAGPDAKIDYLVVAGGGGGGYGTLGGAGGAGGFRYSAVTYCSPDAAPGHPLRATSALPITATAYPITVGAGGGVGPGCSTPASQGSNSIFSTITSTGGGYGASRTANPTKGGDGGSGGGASDNNAPPINGGAGNTPPVSPSQGNPGGDATPGLSGGGGGAVQAGPPGTLPFHGEPGGAGAGLPNAFGTSGENCGSFYYFSGGGAGATPTSRPSQPQGGIGGGGNGGRYPNGTAAEAGTANTGGGGGGAGGPGGGAAAGAGGSGIVIIRYKYQ